MKGDVCIQCQAPMAKGCKHEACRSCRQQTCVSCDRRFSPQDGFQVKRCKKCLNNANRRLQLSGRDQIIYH